MSVHCFSRRMEDTQGRENIDMKFSVGIEYAIHCLIYMVELPEGKSIGVRDLASFQGISESYLSKTFAKLAKAGIVKSTPGVRGGYTLGRDAREIDFWDIIEAVEGNSPLFQCQEIRRTNILLDQDHLPESYTKSPCMICDIMNEGQHAMEQYFRTKTIYWLYDDVFNHQFTPEQRKKTVDWFANHCW